MPVLGLGTSQCKYEDAKRAVEHAISIGYRHIDCAKIYGNEDAVGEAINNKITDGTVSREDLFITTKTWCSFHAPDHVSEGFELSLKSLNLDYVDLYLVHWPMAWKYCGQDFPDLPEVDESVDYVDTWKAVEKLYKSKRVKAIGVSNFNREQLNRVLEEAEFAPSVLQIECHPYLDQGELISFCKTKNIAVTAYSPFVSPARSWIKETDPNVFTDPVLLHIAKKHKKNIAQVILRYILQLGISVIPKSITPERIEKNFQVFDFDLPEEDCRSIRKLDMHRRIIPPKISNLHHHKYFPFPEKELI